jgi:hypothetical protein
MRPHWHKRLESRAEAAAGIVLAIIVGVVLAAALVHWWSM